MTPLSVAPYYHLSDCLLKGLSYFPSAMETQLFRSPQGPPKATGSKRTRSFDAWDPQVPSWLLLAKTSIKDLAFFCLQPVLFSKIPLGNSREEKPANRLHSNVAMGTGILRKVRRGPLPSAHHCYKCFHQGGGIPASQLSVLQGENWGRKLFL